MSDFNGSYYVFFKFSMNSIKDAFYKARAIEWLVKGYVGNVERTDIDRYSITYIIYINTAYVYVGHIEI